DRISRIGRLTGIVWAIGSVLILYHFLLNIASRETGFFSALLFGFGTWHLSLGAQGPSMQSATVFLHILNLHLLWRFCGDKSASLRRDAVMLGALHALIWNIRPQDIWLLAPVGLLLLERRQALVPYLLPLGVGVAVTAGINKSVYGDWLGLYGVLVHYGGMKPSRWE